MTSHEIIQLVTGFIGSLCFGILFNLHGWRLAVSALGGLFTWGLFLLFSFFIKNDPLCYFIVAAIISFYSEIMARVLKTPATPIITTSLVPLIPGSSLYYTMSYAFHSNWIQFWEKAVSTLKLASALALGILCVTAMVQLFFKILARKNKKCSK
ncbi:MAG: threonine/serine exporter family protein [Ruminococcus sp.]|nr:threonine/serine exporter family protein [Ruminococcus sp.]